MMGTVDLKKKKSYWNKIDQKKKKNHIYACDWVMGLWLDFFPLFFLSFFFSQEFLKECFTFKMEKSLLAFKLERVESCCGNT